MSIDFVAIDFETANQNRASACSVGLTKVVNGQIVDEFYTLINPEDDFDYFNTMIHGINKDTVSSAFNYSYVIQEIKNFVGDFPLVAHYAPFDMGVIRDSNDRYQITNIRMKYFDSYYLSKQYIKSISYKLNYLCDMLGIPLEHHNALSDSQACANLILFLCKDNNYSSIHQLLDGARYSKMGAIINSEGSGFRRKKDDKNYSSQSINIKEILDSIDKDSLNSNHVFFEKHACFTGKLESMLRLDAMTIFAKLGGIPEKSVNKKVNFLIMGEQDFRVVGEDLKSSKILKAEKLLSSGQEIQLLSEDEFLRMLGD